jgi:hypothetical protein
MSVTSISDLAHQHMLNILGYGSAGQASGLSNNGLSSGLTMGGANSGTLSPFAQMLSQLQKLEQSSPTQYAQVSQQISTNLSAAASTAQTRGNSKLATQLNTLSKDFSTASQTGQLPNVTDLESVMHSVGQTAAASASSAISGAGSHSKAINIIGQVLGMVGI